MLSLVQKVTFRQQEMKIASENIQVLRQFKTYIFYNENLVQYQVLIFQYADLLKKRKIVLNDKAKIAAVIAELDQKKNEALKKAWEQVNKVRKIDKICINQ